MIEYNDLVAYLGEDRTTVEEVGGLLLDVINGILPAEQLKEEILDYKEHDE